MPNQKSNDGTGRFVSHANICFSCERAVGGCPWSAIDKETGKVKFEPVPGWTAKKVKLRLGVSKSKIEYVDTYHITACPLYEPSRKR